MYITILDFFAGSVFVRKVPKELKEQDGEDIITAFEAKLGIHASDCQYMISDVLSIDLET